MFATDSKAYEHFVRDALIEKGVDPKIAALHADLMGGDIPRMVEGDLVIEIVAEPRRWDRDDIQGIIIRDDVDVITHIVLNPEYQPLIG